MLLVRVRLPLLGTVTYGQDVGHRSAYSSTSARRSATCRSSASAQRARRSNSNCAAEALRRAGRLEHGADGLSARARRWWLAYSCARQGPSYWTADLRVFPADSRRSTCGRSQTAGRGPATARFGPLSVYRWEYIRAIAAWKIISCVENNVRCSAPAAEARSQGARREESANTFGEETECCPHFLVAPAIHLPSNRRGT